VGRHRSVVPSEYVAVSGAGVAAIVAGAARGQRKPGMAGVAATGAGLAASCAAAGEARTLSCRPV
jgi:hypothetical protein